MTKLEHSSLENKSKNENQNLPSLRKILVIGSGGRENSLAWAFGKCPGIEKVFVAPGNGGTEDFQRCVPLNILENESQSLIKHCIDNQIDLVVIGPEVPLSKGLADDFRENGIIVFGPGAIGAQLEASKKWAKTLMEEANVPTARYWAVTNKDEALRVVNSHQKPLVVKADGLAAGKGVIVPETLEETKKAIEHLFAGKFGSAGKEIVLEEKLSGPEVSIFALSDGQSFILLPPAQDHKRLKEGDLGPNTGGMGAYAPANLITKKDLETISKEIIKPTLNHLKSRNIDYRGVIYAGLMLTINGPKVIEFNCRFGDPECQALMPLMGNEFAEVIFACALGKLSKAPNLSISSNFSACVVAAANGYPDNPRKGDPITISIEKDSSLKVFQAGTSYNSEGQLITDGGRVLSVVCEDKNFDKAFEKVYAGLKQIKFPGIIYRNDIGHQVRRSNKTSDL